MKKRFFVAMMLVSVMAFGMTACGSKAESPTPVESVEEEPESSMVEEAEAEESEEESIPEPEAIEITYYEEQEEIPMMDAFVGEKWTNSSSGKSESGKYVHLNFGYSTLDEQKNDRVDEIFADYIAYLEGDGFEVKAVEDPETESLTKSQYTAPNPGEVEMYHICTAGTPVAALTYSDVDHMARIYLLDAWEPGTRPSEEDHNKETAYGDYNLAVISKDGMEAYEFVFVGGELVTVYIDGAEAKGGYGEGCGSGIENSPFYLWTVEDVLDKFDNDDNYLVGEDLYQLAVELQNQN